MSEKRDANPAEGDGLPVLTDKAAKTRERDFRLRENADRTAAENEGLPSVNRRSGANRLITILGMVFIVGAGSAMILAVNQAEPTAKRKNLRDERISNNLPPLIAPSPPPPMPAAGPQLFPARYTPPAPPPAASTPPIPVQGPPSRTAPNGRLPLTWDQRKMGGDLLVDSQGRPSAVSAQHSHSTVLGADGTGPSSSTLNANAAGGRFSGQSEFGVRLEPTVTRAVSASVLPDRNFLITKGTTLDCALETALDSTLPGVTTCRVTRDVYSDNGQVLLLDRGTQLVGEYQGGMRLGQGRLFVLWSRAKTPNGVVVSLNSPGTDALGRSGLEGWVDNHFIERFGAAILMSLIKDGVTVVANRGESGSSGGTTNVYGSAASGGEKVVEKILESTANIPPTLVKNQGDHIQVMVARDLDFSGVYDLRMR